MNAMGTKVTQAYFSFLYLMISVVPTPRAMAASSWLDTPNMGQMRRYASRINKISPGGHNHQARADDARQPSAFAPAVCTPVRRVPGAGNGATRVPASTVVRIKSASNMSAKLYQYGMRPFMPGICDRMEVMPTASETAPPGPALHVDPTIAESSLILWTGNPSAAMASNESLVFIAK